MKKKRRRRNKKNRILSVINGILIVLVMISLAGSLYVIQKVNGGANQIRELLKEKKELEKTIGELDSSIEEQKQALEKMIAKQEETETSEVQEPEIQEEETEPEVGAIDGIQEALSSQISDRVSAGENWGTYVCRLSDGAEAVAGDGKMVAASLIKLYIMGAVYEDYDNITNTNGKDKVDGLLYSMITVSDNDASNTLTKMLGKGDAAAGRAAVTSYCAENGYNDSSMGRMLLETGTDRENYTSAKDCGKFLRAVYDKKVTHADDMLSLLKQQTRTGKIPAGVPAGVQTANKTGELANVENDAAIVFKEGNPYILCVMSGNLSAPGDAQKLIKNISADVYEKIK